MIKDMLSILLLIVISFFSGMVLTNSVLRYAENKHQERLNNDYKNILNNHCGKHYNDPECK